MAVAGSSDSGKPSSDLLRSSLRLPARHCAHARMNYNKPLKGEIFSQIYLNFSQIKGFNNGREGMNHNGPTFTKHTKLLWRTILIQLNSLLCVSLSSLGFVFRWDLFVSDVMRNGRMLTKESSRNPGMLF